MAPVAWLVLGQGHQHSVYLEQARAAAAAVQQRGLLKPLVLLDDVNELVAAAYQHGLHALQPAVGAEPWRGAEVHPLDAQTLNVAAALQNGGAS
jgi:hypothetical protein